MVIENLKIKKLTKEDLNGAYNVFKISIPEAFKQSEDNLESEIIEAEINNKRILLESSIKNEKESMTFLIAKDKEKVIGTIAYGKCSNAIKECTNDEFNNIGELNSLFILPEYQNKGVGSRLINELVKTLKKKGIKEFCLDSGYKQAQKRWLRKFGNPYIIVKDFWAPGIDNMVWRCEIK